ncbi:MAG: M23 family metallopeptidase [Candidatus Cryptobacteroides sp.]|nr:M23 family metallopeptidase [Bacteroidales bacterium]MDY3963203.1 M23 family metallopeptidase [Candidatus Cryptobacteroides sp.]
MKTRYEFDKDFNFRKVTHSVWGMVRTTLKWLVATVSLAAFYYIVFSFFLNTEEERRLKRENRMYEKLYPQMKEKEQLISDVIKDLRLRDDAIYERLFHAQAPQMDPMGSMSFVFAGDSIPDKDMVEYTSGKAALLARAAESVDSGFLKIFSCAAKCPMPPVTVPLPELKFAQVGASVGQKLNPFYKVMSQHNGVDLIVGQGTPVLAAGDGVVTDVSKSGKGLGNVVEITHDGGYVTRYAHLQDIVVRKGERVKTGKKIACVGISGNSFAPHLHYEIYRDGELMDPVNFFFASFTPEEYTKAAYMSATTGQSMD